MKKIPNVITAQRILKPSLLALIIAGSRFLPNASAMRWTVDFKNKQGGPYIEASDLKIYTKALNFGEAHPLEEIGEGTFMPSVDWLLAYSNSVEEIAEMRTAETRGVVREDEDDGRSENTIVLENGILCASEARELLRGVYGAFDIEFIKCSGTLALNEDLKKHANSILIQDCKFKTAPDCFKNIKHLKFSDTTLTPENGHLGIDKTTEVCFEGNNKVLMLLETVLVLEQSGKMPCVPNDKSERTGEEVAKLKENYEKMKELNRKLLNGKQEQRQTIEALKDKIAKMQKAREEDMRKPREKYEKKMKNFENKLKEELKRRDKDIEAKNKRIKDLEEHTEGSKNACAKAVAKIKELEALVEDKQRKLEDKQRELEGKNFDLTSGKNKAPAISDSQDHDAAPTRR